MKIEFIKEANNPNSYSILEQNRVLFSATYDRRTEMKLLYTSDNKLIARGFSFYKKNLQFTEEYIIQLMEESPVEVEIRTKSFLFQTKQFSFENSDFVIIPHRGFRFSIFKGKKQVASYQTYSLLSGSSRMILICNDDMCKSLFILVSLYLYSDFGNEGALPNAPFNFWFQAKKNDKNWKPDSSC